MQAHVERITIAACYSSSVWLLRVSKSYRTAYPTNGPRIASAAGAGDERGKGSRRERGTATDGAAASVEERARAHARRWLCWCAAGAPIGQVGQRCGDAQIADRLPHAPDVSLVGCVVGRNLDHQL